MEDTDVAERVAVLETQMENLEAQVKEAHTSIEEKQAEADTHIRTLLSKFERYEARLGGIFLVLAAVAAFIKWKWSAFIILITKP